MTKPWRAAAVAGAAALALAACGGGSSGSTTTAPSAVPSSAALPTEKVSLTLWWWGEQEAPGAEKWLKAAIAAYTAKHPNITITPVLQTTDGLIPSFQAAAAAKKGPDIQYFWGGIYSQEPGWKGSITPVSDHIPADELKHYLNAQLEEGYQGKTWTAPWYVNPSFPVLVRKDLLAANGLTVPTTWADLMKACDTLSAKGITTLAGGVKDGWFGGWLYSMLGGQSVASQKDVVAASVGKQSFTDPTHAQWWTRLKESKDHKCWNNDINSLELYQAQQRFVEGKAAMTVTAGPDAPNFVTKAGGPDKVQIIAMPTWGTGPYAGKMGTTSQTLGITSWTKYPQVAADFIMFTHTPEQLKAFFDATGAMPADDRFDVASVTDPVRKALFEQVLTGGAPYLENFIPAQLDSDAVFKNVQLVLQGSQTPEGAAKDMQATADRLRRTDRELVKNFTAWVQ
jgi:raffinose/stachyose/melibiose transport system substrate-binding protein